MKTRTSILIMMAIATAFLIGTSIVDGCISVGGLYFFGLCSLLSGIIVIVNKLKK